VTAAGVEHAVDPGPEVDCCGPCSEDLRSLKLTRDAAGAVLRPQHRRRRMTPSSPRGRVWRWPSVENAGLEEKNRRRAKPTIPHPDRVGQPRDGLASR